MLEQNLALEIQKSSCNVSLACGIYAHRQAWLLSHAHLLCLFHSSLKIHVEQFTPANVIHADMC